uniref:Uncharacterized protein n=1 Tax=Glossina palpalis gambiensis TaxID=67801 RepID=A0A1B0B7F8_9MUSC
MAEETILYIGMFNFTMGFHVISTPAAAAATAAEVFADDEEVVVDDAEEVKCSLSWATCRTVDELEAVRLRALHDATIPYELAVAAAAVAVPILPVPLHADDDIIHVDGNEFLSNSILCTCIRNYNYHQQSSLHSQHHHPFRNLYTLSSVLCCISLPPPQPPSPTTTPRYLLSSVFPLDGEWGKRPSSDSP